MNIQEFCKLLVPFGEVVVAMTSHHDKIVIVTDRGTLFTIDTTSSSRYWPPGI